MKSGTLYVLAVAVYASIVAFTIIGYCSFSNDDSRMMTLYIGSSLMLLFALVFAVIFIRRNEQERLLRHFEDFDTEQTEK